MTTWTTAVEARRYAQARLDSINYEKNTPFADDAAFETFITDTLIPRAQAHINGFCKSDFDTDCLLCFS